MINLCSKGLTNLNYCALFRYCFLSSVSQFMQLMLILSVTTLSTHHVRISTARQRPIKHCKCFTPNISCLDTFNFLVIKSAVWSHFRWLDDNGNGRCLVLHPGRPPPAPRPRGRHLHRRGWPLPLDEGEDIILPYIFNDWKMRIAIAFYARTFFGLYPNWRINRFFCQSSFRVEDDKDDIKNLVKT